VSPLLLPDRLALEPLIFGPEEVLTSDDTLGTSLPAPVAFGSGRTSLSLYLPRWWLAFIRATPPSVSFCIALSSVNGRLEPGRNLGLTSVALGVMSSSKTGSTGARGVAVLEGDRGTDFPGDTNKPSPRMRFGLLRKPFPLDLLGVSNTEVKRADLPGERRSLGEYPDQSIREGGGGDVLAPS
jgi:hypothetical protein